VALCFQHFCKNQISFCTFN